MPSPDDRPVSSRRAEAGITLLFAAVSFGVGLYRVDESGPLWPDAPRYANAGAMARDWAASGRFLDPVGFAKDNYARYPAFSVPYHPPGYPAALGAWFAAFGGSYRAARAFVAACFALCAWCFYRTNRELGVGPAGAAGAGLLLLTTPQLAVWARDTMSEVPSLAPLLAGTLCWVRWLKAGRRADGLGAAVLFEVAFLFRVTTAGVLPGLALFGWLTGGLPRRRLGWAAGYAVLYLAVNAAWVGFSARYSAHEVAADGKGELRLGQAAEYLAENLPRTAATGTAAVALAGAVAAAVGRAGRPAAGLWVAWGVSYVVFKVAVPTTQELRHLATAVPALAGLAAGVFPPPGVRAGWRSGLAAATVAGGVAVNLWLLSGCSSGVVGYDAVAGCLARETGPGNVLLACWEDQDFIFRYRAAGPARQRFCIRGDRTLAVRESAYANQPVKVVATTEDDVLTLVERGRVGYVLTCAPRPGSRDVRTPEMALAERAVCGRPDRFRPVGTFPVSAEYVDGAYKGVGGEVTVWAVAGPVADGPPQLPVLVPTAGLAIEP